MGGNSSAVETVKRSRPRNRGGVLKQRARCEPCEMRDNRIRWNVAEVMCAVFPYDSTASHRNSCHLEGLYSAARAPCASPRSCPAKQMKPFSVAVEKNKSTQSNQTLTALTALQPTPHPLYSNQKGGLSPRSSAMHSAGQPNRPYGASAFPESARFVGS